MANERTAEQISAELDEISARVRAGEDGDGDAGGDNAAPQSPEAKASLAAAENEASRKGWVPKDQYKGDATKWVDAKTFIDRGERFTVNLQREVQQLRAKIDGFEGTKAAFKKFADETIAKKEAENKTLMTELRKQRATAIREGEDDTVVVLEERMETLKEQQQQVATLEVEPPATDVTGPNPQDPVLNEWIDDGNQWFNDDADLRRYAIALGENFIQNDKQDGVRTETGRPFLDRLVVEMQKQFPRRFKKLSDKDTRPGSVESGGKGGSGSNGKSERDLPEEDLKLMKEFISNGWTTREKFLTSYFSR